MSDSDLNTFDESFVDYSLCDPTTSASDKDWSIGQLEHFAEPFPNAYYSDSEKKWSIGADTGTFNNDSYLQVGMLRQRYPGPSSDQTVWTNQLTSSSGCIPSPPVGLSSSSSDSASDASFPLAMTRTKKRKLKRTSVTPELDPKFYIPIIISKELRYYCTLCLNDPGFKQHYATKLGDLRRHLQVKKHGPKSFHCPNRDHGCQSIFTRDDSLRRHLENASCRRWANKVCGFA